MLVYMFQVIVFWFGQKIQPTIIFYTVPLKHFILNCSPASSQNLSVTSFIFAVSEFAMFSEVFEVGMLDSFPVDILADGNFLEIGTFSFLLVGSCEVMVVFSDSGGVFGTFLADFEVVCPSVSFEEILLCTDVLRTFLVVELDLLEAIWLSLRVCRNIILSFWPTFLINEEILAPWLVFADLGTGSKLGSPDFLFFTGTLLCVSFVGFLSASFCLWFWSP